MFKVNFKNGWNCGWLHYILLFCLSYYLYKAVIYPHCGLLKVTRLHRWDSWMRTATETEGATWIDIHLLALCFSILCKKASLKNRREKKEFQSFWLGPETMPETQVLFSLCLHNLYSIVVQIIVILSAYLLRALKKKNHCFWIPKKNF